MMPIVKKEEPVAEYQLLPVPEPPSLLLLENLKRKDVEIFS